jgi:hypothetical protein
MKVLSRLLLIVTFFIPGPTHAADQDWQFWPEADVFLNLNPDVRLLFLYGATREFGTRALEDYQVAAYVDLLASRHRPLVRFTPDAGKHSRLDLRAGYSHYVNTSGDQSIREHRYVVQFNARFQPRPQPTYFFNRSRFELRDVDEQDFSWRYRNRSRVEGNYAWKAQNLTPYAMAEFFWDSRSTSWTRGLYTFGLEWSFPGLHTVVDLNMNVQDEWQTDARTTYAPGLTLNFYF